MKKNQIKNEMKYNIARKSKKQSRKEVCCIFIKKKKDLFDEVQTRLMVEKWLYTAN